MTLDRGFTNRDQGSFSFFYCFLMVVMMSVVMMVVMPRALLVLYVAVLLVAMLTLCLKLKRYVMHAVLRELFPYALLYFMSVSACDYVHSGVIALPVHTPYVNVVDIKHAFDLANMLTNLRHLDAVWRFFKKEVDCLLQVFERIYEDKYRNADGHNWIYDLKICKSHHNCADEYDHPAENVLKHMEIDRPLI